MAPKSLASSYSVKELQIVVRDAPVIPVEILPFAGRQFTSSRQVWEIVANVAHLPTETFFAMHLNGKNKMVGMTTCSMGCMTSALVHPRDVFRPAIANLTAGLIFVHNHPSGDPAPSREDREVTERLAEVGRLVGIKVLDHIVIGDGCYYSFADQGLL